MRSVAGLALVLFAVYATGLLIDARPGERVSAGEAHVLLTAESIVSDGDVDLADQYDEAAYSRFYGRTLEPTAPADDLGRIFEPQGVGLALLIAPAWAIGGVTAVKLWLALLAAASFAFAASLARRLVPDPWAGRAALVGGLSAPAFAAATTIRPEAVTATALTGAAVLALRVREEPRAALAFWGALLIAIVPWIGMTGVLPAAVVALALARWLRRRHRGLAGFVALEVVLTSAVVFITINERLFGGVTPYAGRLGAGEPLTGIRDGGDVIARIPRLAELLGEVALWAPFGLLAGCALWLLWRSRRERLAKLVDDQIHVEVVATFLALACAAQVFTAAFLAPSIDGEWFDTRFLVPVIPLGTALAAWGLRRLPRLGAGLAALTIAITLWVVIAGVAGDATLAPPRGFGI